VRVFYTRVDRNAHWIMAGDLNGQPAGLQGAVNDSTALNPSLPPLEDTQELHH